MITITELEGKTKDELADLAENQGVSGISGLKKHGLNLRLLQAQAEQQG